MIFGGIDGYLDKLALTSSLGECRRYLEEAQQEINRLSEENVDLLAQKQIRDYQLNRRRPLDMFLEESSKQHESFIEGLEQTRIEQKIKEYISNYPRVSQYFLDFVHKKQRQHLENFLMSPNRWSREQIQRVKKGIESIQQRQEKEKKDYSSIKWVVDKEKTEIERRKLEETNTE
jgi:hypothetical protein